MNKHLLHSYYFLLSIVSLGMVIFTIYTSSQTVSYGQTVNQLEKQKDALVAQQTDLERQISQQDSLTTVQQLAQAGGYIPTVALLQLPRQTQVALR